MAAQSRASSSCYNDSTTYILPWYVDIIVGTGLPFRHSTVASTHCLYTVDKYVPIRCGASEQERIERKSDRMMDFVGFLAVIKVELSSAFSTLQQNGRKSRRDTQN
jgi:hypothetical protein